MQQLASDTKSQTATIVGEVLEGFLAAKQADAADISPYYGQLWAEIARLMHSGGKRLRPRMVLMSYQLFGGRDVAAIAPAAAAQELLHLGMLIHDDIIDRDYVRYGVENIAGAYLQKYQSLVTDPVDRRHFSHSASILAGDLLLSEAYRLMAESRVDAEKILSIQQLLGRGVFEVVGGELLDTELAFRGVSAILPETVAIYKTASYTFVLPMLVGAQLAGASIEDQAVLRTFCRQLGIAFQLRDDIIGVFGDEAETGKTTIGDLREGKCTYMVEQFYQRASPEQQTEFTRYFGQLDLTPGDAELARELLVAAGALAATERAIGEYEAAARQTLSELSIDSRDADELHDFIAAVTARTK